MIRKQFMISGKVQRVCFRGSTREQALALGLSGYVRNLADGRVEVEVQGSDDAVDQLAQWLQHGPVLAEVVRVVAIGIGLKQADTGFNIL